MFSDFYVLEHPSSYDHLKKTIFLVTAAISDGGQAFGYDFERGTFNNHAARFG